MVAVARKKDVSAAPLSEFAADAIAGLSDNPKRLQPKYFYDAEGSRLFEQITETPEYYPTRCEMQALRSYGKDVVALIPKDAALVEFGSGSSRKVRLLLAAKPELSVYVPVDISAEMLARETAAVRADYPALPVHPVVADFTMPFVLPREAVEAEVRVGFFPGSTIGNFEPHQAANFLRNAAAILGRGSIMLIGVDLIKETSILNAAYNDAGGVTARFNLNVLKRMNRELNANFDLDTFEHHAFFNRARSRVEMHLASRKRKKVRVAGETFSFDVGETIHTESSYKYSIQSFSALARGADWSPLRSWTDEDGYFSIQAFVHAPEGMPST
jgi:dimethylhistidine N-methyltransferase